MKKHIALILIICVLFSATGCVFLPNKPEETTEPTVLVTTVPSITKDEFYSYVNDISENTSTVYNYYKCYWDGDVLTIALAMDGLFQSAKYAKGGNQSCYNSWTTISESYSEFTATLRKYAVDNGLDNAHVALNIMNDTNKDMTLFSVYDGVVTYNFVTD